MKKILLLIIALTLVSCGGGGSSATNGTPIITPPVQPTSTTIITQYMELKHKTENIAFEQDKPLYYPTSAWYSDIINSKLGHISHFVQSSLQYITSTKSSFILDKPAIKQLFTSYQSIDGEEITGVINSAYGGRGNSPESQLSITYAVGGVNNIYRDALLQLDIM